MLLFRSLQTQWVHGFGGPVGLSYPAVYPLLDRLTADQPPGAWDRALADLQILELEALSAMRERNV